MDGINRRELRQKLGSRTLRRRGTKSSSGGKFLLKSKTRLKELINVNNKEIRW